MTTNYTPQHAGWLVAPDPNDSDAFERYVEAAMDQAYQNSQAAMLDGRSERACQLVIEITESLASDSGYATEVKVLHEIEVRANNHPDSLVLIEFWFNEMMRGVPSAIAWTEQGEVKYADNWSEALQDVFTRSGLEWVTP